MSWLPAALPLIALVWLHPASTEPEEQTRIADDQFVATCVDLDAEEIDTVALCVVGLDGSVEVRAEGLVPGRQVALSADRRLVAVATADDVLVVDAAGQPVASVPIESATGLAWLPDAASLLVQTIADDAWSIQRVDVGADDGTDATAPEVVASGHGPDGAVRRGIAATPDGESVVQAMRAVDGSTLTAIDIASGTAEDVFESDDEMSVPDVSPDGDLVAAVVGTRIEVVDLSTGEVVHVVEQRNPVTTPSFSPDGSQLMFVEAHGAVEFQDLGDEASDRVVVDITRGDDASEFPANPTWS